MQPGGHAAIAMAPGSQQTLDGMSSQTQQ
eukprot:COSAG01_NODE_31299_length_600_cov_0.822355_1_plen_28_part_10